MAWKVNQDKNVEDVCSFFILFKFVNPSSLRSFLSFMFLETDVYVSVTETPS